MKTSKVTLLLFCELCHTFLCTFCNPTRLFSMKSFNNTVTSRGQMHSRYHSVWSILWVSALSHWQCWKSIASMLVLSIEYCQSTARGLSSVFTCLHVHCNQNGTLFIRVHVSRPEQKFKKKKSYWNAVVGVRSRVRIPLEALIFMKYENYSPKWPSHTKDFKNGYGHSKDLKIGTILVA